MSEKKYEELIRKLVQKSFGQIERCIIASEDGLPLITHGNPDEINEILAAIASPLFAATQDVIKNLEDTEIVKIDVELGNSKHLIIAPLHDNVIAILSSQRPNLGLIYYLLEQLPSKLETNDKEVKREPKEKEIKENKEEKKEIQERRESFSSSY